ncbi:phage protein Gp27 family protein, partial [Escherichia coli]|uniref:phage protein Gp27 family protein n=1 Tax=Escherichia coli TaxID=562 RepID=UPI00398CD6B7
AQKGSAAYRKTLEDRVNAQIEKAAQKVGEAEQVMREAGLSADQVAQIRRDVLGLRV